MATTPRRKNRYPEGTDAPDVPLWMSRLAADLDDAPRELVPAPLGDRPAASENGRWFRATDTGQVFRDTGASWEEMVRASDLARGAFLARPLTSFGKLPTGTNVFPADDEKFDVSGWYDNAAFRYNPKVAGIYRLSATIILNGTLAAGKTLSVALWRQDGAFMGTLGAVSGAGNYVAGGSILVQANGTTDAYEVRVTHDLGFDANILGTSFVSGEMVGRV